MFAPPQQLFLPCCVVCLRSLTELNSPLTSHHHSLTHSLTHLTTPSLPPSPHSHNNKAWYAEIESYSFANGDYSSATGHATQLLWRASTRLGCGWAAGCKLLVCHYDPPGNVVGQFRDNVLPPSTSGAV